MEQDITLLQITFTDSVLAQGSLHGGPAGTGGVCLVDKNNLNCPGQRLFPVTPVYASPPAPSK